MRKINSHFADFEQAKKINSRFALQTLNKRKKYFADFEQIKKIVILLLWTNHLPKTPSGETRWLTGHHAMPLVTLFFGITMSLGNLLVIYRNCYGFERGFFTLRHFLLCTPSCCFQGFPGAGSSTPKLAGLHADLRNDKNITS